MSSAWTSEHVERVREALAALQSAGPVRPDDPRLPRLALLSSFRIEDFDDDPGAALREDSVALAADPSHRMLKDGIRRRILSRLGTREALAEALLASPDRPDDVLQRAIDAAVTGQLPPLTSQTPDQLRATLQVADWFADTAIASDLPAAGALRARLERENLLGPLRELGGAHFRGRVTELAALRAFVDEEGGPEAPPLLIFGPGGMGKSTLVARFILDNVGRMPLAYLDCDRPGIVAMEPVTLLAEVVRQLALQFPGLDSAAARLRARWHAKLAADGEAGAGAQAPVTVGRETVMQELKLFLDTLPAEDRRLLLVVDTFEEVQYRSRALVAEIFTFLAELQALLPRLRTVIAGRNRVPGLPYVPLEIGPLDLESTCAILASLGVAPEATVEALGAHLAGNPLSLRLAAELWCGTEGAGLEDIAAIADEVDLQGILYGRILAHLHDDQVRDIAHPGLILRRITPDIIEKVLADPCGLGAIDHDRAGELFGLLREEMSLVIPEDDDSVRHRRDVRRIMLRPLRRERAETVRTIEEAAIRYYSGFDDPISRAEEIYHRLSLGQPPSLVEPRWLDGVEESLRFAVDELEGESRAFLAARLGIEIYDVDLNEVDQSTWELVAARQSADLLKLDKPLEAVELLRRRSRRLPQSPLYWFHAQALRRCGLLLESREVARAGLAELMPDRADATGEAERLIEWYSGSEVAAPPDAADVERQLSRFRREKALQQRTGTFFVGRRSEIAALHSYVSSPSTSSLNARRALFVEGPGGSGKTALLSQYLVEQGDSLISVWIHGETFAGPSRVPGVFFRGVAEIAQQLARIFPGTGLDEIARSLPGESPYSSAERLSAALQRTEVLASGEKPLLVVVDDAEHLGTADDAFGHIHDLLAGLSRQVPRFRAVFLGRAVPPGGYFDVLTIGGLDAQSAETLLVSEKIDSDDARAAILRESQGHPLMMCLMIDVYRRDGELPSFDLEPHEQLSDRLLNRLMSGVADLRLAQILPTALLFRRIDPELFRTVVLPAAGDGPVSREEADILFERLSHETAFVSREGTMLVPRRDVRRMVARLLRRRSPDLAAAVDRAAIAFHEERDGLADRAEEIYHRLVASDSWATVDGRWRSGVEAYLEDAADELEDSPRNYLYARLTRHSGEFDWLDAEQDKWEDYAVARSESLRRTGRLDEALELLRKRSARLPRSRLYAIEGSILAELGRSHEALAVVENGLHGLPDDAELLALRERCRGQLGVEEFAPTEEGTAPERVRLRVMALAALRRSDHQTLVEALAKTLPTSLDLMSAWREFDFAYPIDAQPHRILLSRILEKAAAEGYLEDLLVAALAYAPRSALMDLTEDRRGGFASAAFEPWESRVEGGLILNRLVLRRFVGGLQDPTRRQHVLFVVGPEGSGKSSTGRIARRFAAQAGDRGHPIRIHEIAIGGDVSPDSVAQALFATFEWRWEKEEQPESLSVARQSFGYAQMVVDRFKRLESGGRHDVLILSANDRLRMDSREMLQHLIAAPNGPAFILVGLAPFDAADRIHSGEALVEMLGDFTPEDIREGLERFLRENGIDTDPDPLCRSIVANAAGEAPYNAAVSRLAHQLIAELVGRSAI